LVPGHWGHVTHVQCCLPVVLSAHQFMVRGAGITLKKAPGLLRLAEDRVAAEPLLKGNTRMAHFTGALCHIWPV
jgi:hypothetical protein